MNSITPRQQLTHEITTAMMNITPTKWVQEEMGWTIYPSPYTSGYLVKNKKGEHVAAYKNKDGKYADTENIYSKSEMRMFDSHEDICELIVSIKANE